MSSQRRALDIVKLWRSCSVVRCTSCRMLIKCLRQAHELTKYKNKSMSSTSTSLLLLRCLFHLCSTFLKFTSTPSITITTTRFLTFLTDFNEKDWKAKRTGKSSGSDHYAWCGGKFHVRSSCCFDTLDRTTDTGSILQQTERFAIRYKNILGVIDVSFNTVSSDLTTITVSIIE